MPPRGACKLRDANLRENAPRAQEVGVKEVG
jgi:hypothetical protein